MLSLVGLDSLVESLSLDDSDSLGVEPLSLGELDSLGVS